MKRMQTKLTSIALAAAVGVLATSAPAAFAHGPDRHYKADKHYYKAREKAYKKHQKEMRKAYKKAYKEEQKAYRRWARGEYMHRDYLADRYYVRDYRAYNLAPPPYGYRYVRPYQDDDTYYMVQIATGLISQIFGR